MSWMSDLAPAWRQAPVKLPLCVISSTEQRKKKSTVFTIHSEWRVGGEGGEPLKFVLSHPYERQREGWLVLMSPRVLLFPSLDIYLLFYLYLFWKPPDHVEASGSDSLSPNSLYSFSFNCPGRFAYSLGCICASRQSVMQTLLRYGIYVNTKKLENQNSDHIPAIPPWAWEAWLWLRRKGKGSDNEQGLLYSKHDKYTLWLG